MRMFQKTSARIRLARCFQAGALCALSLCALPQYAHAQQANSVPVLSRLPIVGKLYRVEPKTPAQPKMVGGQDAGSLLVSLEARSATLDEVLATLMDQAHLSYTLNPTLEKVHVGSL